MELATLKVIHARIKKKGRARSKKTDWGRALFPVMLSMVAGGALGYVTLRLLAGLPKLAATAIGAVTKALLGKGFKPARGMAGIITAIFCRQPLVGFGIAAWQFMRGLVGLR